MTLVRGRMLERSSWLMLMNLRLRCMIARLKHRAAYISVETETQFGPATSRGAKSHQPAFGVAASDTLAVQSGVDRELQALVGGASSQPAAIRFEAAVDHWNTSIIDIQKVRGEIWGDGSVQLQRNAFVDNTLMAGALATKWVNTLKTQSHVAALIISRELSAWHIHRNAIGSLGGQLYARANGELLGVAHVISGLEVSFSCSPKN